MIPVPPHTTLMTYQNLPLQKLAQVEVMTPPHKKGDRATLTHPQITEINDSIGKCITQDALLVTELGWGRFVRESQGRGDFQT